MFIVKKIELISCPINNSSQEAPQPAVVICVLLPVSMNLTANILWSGSGVIQCLFCEGLISLSRGIVNEVERWLIEGRTLEVSKWRQLISKC